jgi:benzoyl-CoA reductase/2-hydroxyglutaryl-CoA dehydratase subunit BcrC/BadD/HgdB
MADGYTRIYLNIGVDQMAESVIRMVAKYHVDALVLHPNRSCKPYSFGQYDIERAVRQKCGIPTLMIEADMTDGRNFSESQIETRIDAFMELLEAGRS